MALRARKVSGAFEKQLNISLFRVTWKMPLNFQDYR